MATCQPVVNKGVNMIKLLRKGVLTLGVIAASGSGVWAAPNILLIIGDDIGVEALASYEIGETLPRTATLDEMAREGVRFTNTWSQPVCTPTRATMLTGRYGFRTGVGGALMTYPDMPQVPKKPESAPYETPPFVPRGMGGGEPVRPAYLKLDEFTLPMALNAGDGPGHTTAAIGKWHLGDVPNGGLEHPELAGFDRFIGSLEGTVPSFFAWNKVVDGEVSGRVGYVPIDKTDDAIAWIAEQGNDPWFLWFALHLPHPPLHLPPAETWQSDYSHLDPKADPAENPYPYFHAMVEAMDTQIGRLLASMDPAVRENTYVIFVGDNGSVMYRGHPEGTPFPVGQGKATIYQGGIHVPLIITGPGVAQGATSDALVNTTDLFATIIEMAGLDKAAVVPDDVVTDSISFFEALSNPEGGSPREWLYVDRFLDSPSGRENADYAMANERYKFMRVRGNEEFYDLQEDPFETDNLLLGELSSQEQTQYQALKDQLIQLRNSE